MKISVSSYSFDRLLRERKRGYREILRLAKEIGFDGVEFIDLANPAWGIAGDEEEIAREVRAAADEYGLLIPAYAVSSDLLGRFPDREVGRIIERLAVARILGASVFRFDASFRLRDLPGYTWEDGIAEMAPRIRSIAEYGRKIGVKTCTENHGFIYQAPERVRKLIGAVRHENFGWLVDVGNFSVVDRDNVEAVKIAAPYAFHVHVKDFSLLPAPREGEPIPDGFNRTAGGALWRGTVPGRGNVDVAGCLSALREAGYDGWVSLEFEGPEDVIPAIAEGYAYLKRLLGK